MNSRMNRFWVIFLILGQISISIPSFALAPKTEIKIYDQISWNRLAETKLLLYGRLIYKFQVDQKFSGDALRKKFTNQLSRQGKSVSNYEKLLLKGLRWDEFRPGYYPFDLQTGDQFVLQIFDPMKKPDFGLAKILAEGELEPGLGFAILKPFDPQLFMKKLMDPQTSIYKVSQEIEWLLEDPTPERIQIVKEAFELIQSLSYARTADIYRKFKDNSVRAKLLKSLDAQAIGRMLFGMLILDRDEAVKRARERIKRDADLLRKDAKKLRESAKEIRAAMVDSKIVRQIRDDLEGQLVETSNQLRKVKERLTLRSKELIESENEIKAQELELKADQILMVTENPQTVRMRVSQMMSEILQRKLRGEDVEVPEDLESLVRAQIEEGRVQAGNMQAQAQQLRTKALPGGPNVLEPLVRPIRRALEAKQTELAGKAEELRLRLNGLDMSEKRAEELASFKKGEEKKAKDLEKKASELEIKARASEEQPVDSSSMLSVAAAKLSSTMKFIESVLAQEDDFTADGITQVGIKGHTSFEKLNSIGEVVQEAQRLFLVEQQGVIHDVSLRAARKEIGQLIGVDEAIQFSVKKMLERGRPRFLLLNSTDYQRADAVSGLAIRLLQDETLPVSIRSKRIYKIDLTELPGQMPKFIDILRGIFSSAQKVGNVVFVIDFSQVFKQFYQHEKILDVIMDNVIGALEDFSFPVIGWVKPEIHQSFLKNKKYAEFFRKSAFLINIKINDFARVLETELADIENNNNVKFPSETVNRALQSLTTDTAKLATFGDLEDLIRVFKDIAAEYQLKFGSEYYLKKQIIPVSLERVEKALETYVTDRKKSMAMVRVGPDQGQRDYEKEARERDLPPAVIERILGEATRLKQANEGSSEASVIRTYLDWILSLPWDRTSEDIKDVKRVRDVLDQDHYGLEKVKQRVIEHLGVIIRKGKSKGEVILLIGPPGVGKTSIGMSIARSIGRKFVRFSVGGMHEEAEIRGHRRTFVGAMPGRIIKAVAEAGTKNPVIMIDEIDKLGRDPRGDPAHALLEVFDPKQNFAFRDHYLDLDFDLSQVLFIATANDMDGIPEALLDRTYPIYLEGYTSDEKIQIAKMHLIPRVLKEHDMTSADFQFANDDVINYIIDNYAPESGVRQLENRITELVRKANLDLLEDKVKKVVIDKKKVEEYLGEPDIKRTKGLDEDEVGVVAGLAVSRMGGNLLFCEASLVPRMTEGKGALTVHVTGNLKDVMKESTEVAWSVVRRHIEELGVDPSEFSGKEIHIHFPAGATPKDGPSAGVTISTALVSLLTGLPVDSKVAMTGEVSLRQKGVHAIGGLKNKALAAYAAGMKKIIIPKANEKDLEDMPPKILKVLKVVAVERVADVWKAAIPGLEKRMKEVADAKKDKKPKTKIRRGDPDVAPQDRETLRSQITPVSHFYLSSPDAPKTYQGTYPRLVEDLRTQLKESPYQDLARILDESFVIHVVTGELGKNLSFDVKGQKVYAFSDGNVICITEDLLKKLMRYPKLFAALILHELVEMTGKTHEDAEESELMFGKISEKLSSLDLVLMGIEAQEAGLLKNVDEFLSQAEEKGVKIENRDEAAKLINEILSEPLSSEMIAKTGAEIFDAYKDTLAKGKTVFVRTDLILAEKEGVVVPEGVPDGVFLQLKELAKLGIEYVVMEGIWGAEALASYEKNPHVNVSIHRGDHGKYLRIGLDALAQRKEVSEEVLKLNPLYGMESKLRDAKVPAEKKVITIDLDLLADIDVSNPQQTIVKPRDFAQNYLALAQEIKKIKNPQLGGSVYDIVLFSKYGGVAEILSAIGLSLRDFDAVYTLEDLQASAGGLYPDSPVAPKLISLIEADYANFGVLARNKDVILIYPDQDKSFYGEEEILREILHLVVGTGETGSGVSLHQSLMTAVNLLSNNGEVSDELKELLNDPDAIKALEGGFKLQPVKMSTKYLEELSRAQTAIARSA